MLRVTTEMTGLPGGPFYNVLHFTGTGPSEAAAAAGAAGQFWGNCRLSMVDDITISFDGVVYEVNEADGQIVNAHVVDPYTFVGDEATERVPDVVQGLITHRSAGYINGRRLTGKIYIPGMTESAWVDGLLSGTAQADLQNYYTILRDAGGVTELAIYSRTGGTSAPSSSATVPPTGAILRSRRT